jgi:hypothetical protein
MTGLPVGSGASERRDDYHLTPSVSRGLHLRFDVDLATIREIITRDLPELKRQIAAVLEEAQWLVEQRLAG